ncbi:MAG: universal stress protein [Burkholderiales bacterium]|nr:universal stress protein [Burkholderiales bacterium]
MENMDVTNRILVPVDGSAPSQQALRFAIDFTRRCGGTEIELLNVQAPIESGLVRAQLSARTIEEGLTGFGEDALQSSRALLDEAGIGYRAQVLIGRFGETICRHALDTGCEEIIMGSRGMGMFGNLMLGSVATQVVQAASLPVTLVKSKGEWGTPFDPVLVAVDGSENALRAVRYVALRARRCGAARVHVLNIQEPIAGSPGSAVDREEAERYRREHALLLTEIARRELDSAGISYEFEMQFGDPAIEIARAARSRACSHVVMGTRGLGAATALMLGSVAYKAIHGVDVPVTLVR